MGDLHLLAAWRGCERAYVRMITNEFVSSVSEGSTHRTRAWLAARVPRAHLDECALEFASRFTRSASSNTKGWPISGSCSTVSMKAAGSAR